MPATRLRVTIPSNRKITVQLPGDIQPGEAELLVTQDAQIPRQQALQTLLNEIEMSNAPGQSLEALNRRLSEERVHWE